MHHFRLSLLLIVILKDSIYTNDILMAMLVECLHYEESLHKISNHWKERIFLAETP
jgi:hypothetical protein